MALIHSGSAMFTMLAKALAGELKWEMGPAQPQPRPGELRRRAALVGGVSGQTRTATYRLQLAEGVNSIGGFVVDHDFDADVLAIRDTAGAFRRGAEAGHRRLTSRCARAGLAA